MPEKTVSDLIFDKFAESVKSDPLFAKLTDELIIAMRLKQGKTKIRELLRKMENEDSKP